MTRGSGALTAPALASERDEDLAQWFWALVRPDFPAEIGFDRALKILQPPAEHPLLGWSECRVRDCDVVVLSRGMLCTSCGRRLAVFKQRRGKIDRVHMAAWPNGARCGQC